MRRLLLPLLSFCFADEVRGQNVALGKNVIASSIEALAFHPYKAVDGHGNSNVNTSTGSCTGDCTRWSSSFNDNQWIYVDLAAQYNLTEVRLYWETADAKDFNIEVSNDASNWTVVHTQDDNITFFNTFNMTGSTARYVRMNGIDRTTGYGFSLYELEVYGTPVVPLTSNIALNAPAVASSINGPGLVATNATDGNGGASHVNYEGGCTGTCTYWASQANDNEWIYVDLGTVQQLAQARFFWENGNTPFGFEVQVSNDASNWTTAGTVTQSYGNSNVVNIAGSSGRYVRMLGLTRLTSIYSMFEFEVYAQQSALPVRFTSFTGALTDAAVQLEWTVSLDNPTLFDIERSNDGVHFSVIGTVKANEPINLTSPFRFRDERPVGGINYYRLHYTEQGSAAIYSKTITVTGKTDASITLFPNPVKGNRFQLNLGAVVTGPLALSIFNSTGKLVHRQVLYSRSQQVIPVHMGNKLPAGVYLVQVTANGNVQKGRLLAAD